MALELLRRADTAMKRKDCKHLIVWTHRAGSSRRRQRAMVGCLCALSVAGFTHTAVAGSIRLWASAVVLEDTIRLTDLAELQSFDQDLEQSLRELVVVDAPQAGGSKIIHREMIRAIVEASGANMAEVTIRGASQCAVARPRVAGTSNHLSAANSRSTRPGPRGNGSAESEAKSSTLGTLREAVLRHFHRELARYGGSAEVVFDRASAHVLELTGAGYEFTVRRRGSQPLGLIQATVDITANGVAVQSVPIVVQVSMLRRVVLARRSINQGATIRQGDVERSTMTFSRVTDLGMSDVARVIGQRAKRFVPAGSIVEADAIESVPLVRRGQLVTLRSVSGAVQIVTTVKAQRSGLLGETIPVRSTDKRRVEFDAVVVGPAAVQIGSTGSVSSSGWALGGRS